MRSQDHQAVMLLEEKTAKVTVNSVNRYATPLLRNINMPTLYAAKEAVEKHRKEFAEGC